MPGSESQKGADAQFRAGGRSIGLEKSTDIWVDFPASDADNSAASLLMHPDVGLWVALGGADHLTEATTRINLAAGGAAGRGDTETAGIMATVDAATATGAPRALRGFVPLLRAATSGAKRATTAKKRSR